MPSWFTTVMRPFLFRPGFRTQRYGFPARRKKLVPAPGENKNPAELRRKKFSGPRTASRAEPPPLAVVSRTNRAPEYPAAERSPRAKLSASPRVEKAPRRTCVVRVDGLRRVTTGMENFLARVRPKFSASSAFARDETCNR